VRPLRALGIRDSVRWDLEQRGTRWFEERASGPDEHRVPDKLRAE